MEKTASFSFQDHWPASGEKYSMKILFLAHRIPFPPNKGDKIRSFNELKYLANLGDVYLGALVDNPEDFKYQKNLEAYCKEIHLAPIDNIFKRTGRRPFPVCPLFS